MVDEVKRDPITPEKDTPILGPVVVEAIAEAARQKDLTILEKTSDVRWPEFILALCRSHEKLRLVMEQLPVVEGTPE